MKEVTPMKTRSYNANIWRQFKKNKPALVALWMLLFIILIAFFADFIANSQPLYAKYRGKTFYPAFQNYFNHAYTDSTLNPQSNKYETIQFDITDWRLLKLEKVVWPIIPYSPNVPDRFNRNYAAPGEEQFIQNNSGELIPAPAKFRHILGTNKIGLDVASGIIHGAKISLKVGILAMGIAAIIGLLLGSFAGYFGDTVLRMSIVKFCLIIAGFIVGFFYAFIVRKYTLLDAAETGILPLFGSLFISICILLICIFIFAGIGHLLQKITFLKKRIYSPVDSIISRFIEIVDSLPKLLLIITLSSLFREKSLYLVMAIIGLTSWTGIARFTRAEFLKNRNLNYTEAAKALGISHIRIIWKHILPNAIAPVFIAIAFGIAGAILAESALSFLGIGVPDDVVTWGSLLSMGRQQFDAWWLVVFPGLAIFITVTAYNLIGEGLRDALDPRLKQ